MTRCTTQMVPYESKSEIHHTKIGECSIHTIKNQVTQRKNVGPFTENQQAKEVSPEEHFY